MTQTSQDAAANVRRCASAENILTGETGFLADALVNAENNATALIAGRCRTCKEEARQ
jgi:hypothetical protein